MRLDVAEAVMAERGVGYVVGDAALRVTDSGGRFSAFAGRQLPVAGDRLLDVVPELTGCEAVLAEIMRGDLPRYQLSLVNRPSVPDGDAAGLAYVDLTLLAWPTTAGEPNGILVVVEDATQRGRREQRVQQQRNELQLLKDHLARQNLALAAANAEGRRMAEMKTLFVSVAAHELRSPLASILAYLELLADGAYGPLSDAQAGALRVVQGSAERLIRLTDTFLDLARLESGRLDLELQPVDMSAVLRSVADEIRPRLAERGQSLVLTCAPDLPAALCDPERIVQAMANVVDNAQKYSPNGTRIDVDLRRAAEPGLIELTVADRGIGIPADDREHVFRRFFRGGEARRREVGGTGLGLHIARAVVELHGGRLWFESRPGGGTVFHVTVPAEEDGAPGTV